MEYTQKFIGGGATKVLTVDDFFNYLKGLDDEGGTVQDIYKSVAWVFRCVHLRANGLSSIPYRILKGEREIEWPISLSRLLWYAEADLSLFGAAYWLKNLKKKDPTSLMRLNPSSMEVKTNRKGIEKFVQTIEGEETDFKEEQMVYFRYWNPADDLGPGVAPAEVALEAAGIMGNLNTWASKFFEAGALPLTVLKVTEGYVTEAEKSRVEKVWDKLLGGVKKAWRTVVMNPGLEAQVIGAFPKDVTMPALEKSVRRQIAVAFGVPQTLMTDSANYATAISDRKQFYDETVKPEAGIIEETLNEQLFGKLASPLTFRFDLEALEIFQEEEKDRSEAVFNLVQAGTPLEAAFEILGYDIPDHVDVTATHIPGMNVVNVPPKTFRAMKRGDLLKQWQKKAIRFLKEEGSAAAPFESAHFEEALKRKVMAELEGCKSAEEVKEMFRDAS